MKSILEINGLGISFGQQEILKDVNFSLARGGLHGLLGSNGCGKTSILNAIVRLIPHEGTIRIDGRRTDTFSRKLLARHVAYMRQQQHHQFDLSVAEVVALGQFAHGGIDPRKIESVLYESDLLELKDRPMTELSGGQKQRVFYAKTLAQESELILIDEGLSNADIYYQLKFLQALKQKTREEGKTILMVLHDLQLAHQFCDDLTVLHEGSLHQSGPADEVMTDAMIRRVFRVRASVQARGIRYEQHIEKRKKESYENQKHISAYAPAAPLDLGGM